MATNPLVDSHAIHALLLVLPALMAAGEHFGLCSRLPIVRVHRWLH